ncbi:MAG: glycosyltransferase family A protein [Methanomicrobiales archaeon]|nr:glycosyltransferase family A protein [Methanomicrobiales archaeon]MDI6877702.1 glycosyltransferase family A protein [Methanomicrobiales archaeon]
MHERVSIIVPVYNAEKYLNRCMDSLINQTYHNKEIIVIADQGQDRSCDILKEYEALGINDLTIVFRTGKSSPAKARNHAINLAKGEYIAFCDADDWWELDKLAQQVRYMQNHPHVDICYTLSGMWRGGRLSEVFGHDTERIPVPFTCPGGFSSFLVRRNATILFDERLKASDDYRWEIDLWNAGKKFALIPEVLTHVWIGDSNLTMKNQYTMFKQTMRVHLIRGEYLLVLQKIGLFLAMAFPSIRKLGKKVLDPDVPT